MSSGTRVGESEQLRGWLTEDTGRRRALALAALVADYRVEHGHGPSWAWLAKTARPQLATVRKDLRNAYTDRLIRNFTGRGFLTYTEDELGSLAPGRQAQLLSPQATTAPEPEHPAAAEQQGDQDGAAR